MAAAVKATAAARLTFAGLWRIVALTVADNDDSDDDDDDDDDEREDNMQTDERARARRRQATTATRGATNWRRIARVCVLDCRHRLVEAAKSGDNWRRAICSWSRAFIERRLRASETRGAHDTFAFVIVICIIFNNNTNQRQKLQQTSRNSFVCVDARERCRLP